MKINPSLRSIASLCLLSLSAQAHGAFIQLSLTASDGDFLQAGDIANISFEVADDLNINFSDISSGGVSSQPVATKTTNLSLVISRGTNVVYQSGPTSSDVTASMQITSGFSYNSELGQPEHHLGFTFFPEVFFDAFGMGSPYVFDDALTTSSGSGHFSMLSVAYEYFDAAGTGTNPFASDPTNQTLALAPLIQNFINGANGIGFLAAVEGLGNNDGGFVATETIPEPSTSLLLLSVSLLGLRRRRSA